ncbi:Palmitoyltransferase ZDHHC3, partial [Geodia barretti]
LSLRVKIPIIARLRTSEPGRLPEAVEPSSDPPALALMTDSSEDEEENEEEQLCGSGDARKIVHYRNDAYAPSGKTRARFMRMAFLKNKSVWFVCDPCGIVCAVMTYLLVLYGQFVMLTVIAPPFPGTWTVLRVLGFSALGGLAVVAHVRSMLTDPGVVARERTSEEEVLERRQKGEDIRYCKRCRSIKPDRAHHCSTCENCIHRMDHHCPWVNNCVGENNQKYFVLFTFYIMVMSVYGLLTVAWFFYTCATQNFEGCDALMPGPLVFVLTLMGVFLGFLFSLFTCIMFCTQIHAICTDETVGLVFPLFSPFLLYFQLYSFLYTLLFSLYFYSFLYTLLFSFSTQFCV